MRPKQGLEARVLASAIVLALLVHPLVSAQQTATIQSSASQPSAGQFPDSPGTVQTALNRPQAPMPESNQADQKPQADSDSQSATPATAPEPADENPPAAVASPSTNASQIASPAAQSQPQEASPHEPRGTAAAEAVQTSGVAASRPAGAAVAPAKQRRMRSILIKVGFLAGAGVAIGTTLALSQGSPSKPPGAH